MQGTKRGLLTLLLAALAVALVAYVFGESVPLPRPGLATRQGPPLGEARSWGYQLQRFDPRRIPDEIDLLVIDYSRDGSDARALTPETLQRLRQRPGRPPRIVLCYMSVGEAESYRFYWHARWQTAPPSWLGPENPEWKRNYAVRYWEPGWKRLIVKSATLTDRVLELLDERRKPYLDRILEAGFDGVYLDRVDAFAQWKDEPAKARARMIALVQEIASYARERRPGFLVVPQNGEELLRSEAYRRSIDGIGKEDLLYGLASDGVANAPEEVKSSASLLGLARGTGLPVFVVEYVSTPAQRAEAYAALTARGFVPLFASRGLTLPPEPIVAEDMAKSEPAPTVGR